MLRVSSSGDPYMTCLTDATDDVEIRELNQPKNSGFHAEQSINNIIINYKEH